MNITKANGKNTVRMTWAMLAAVCVTLLANTTQAGEGAYAPPQQVVRFADLNLTNSAGAAVLYRRIQNAAVKVCGSVEPRDLARAAAAKTYIDRAIAEAISAVNNPILTSQYVAKTGGSEQLVATASLR